MAKKKPAPPDFRWGDQLVLFRYFLSLFGKDTLAGLAGVMNSREYEGFDENQNTFFCRELASLLSRQGEKAKISRDALLGYDENICRHIKQIGDGRGGIRLKYFQYIACLFTEMYLDRYFTDKAAFAEELSAFAEIVKDGSPGGADIGLFTPANMNKLAFMCATGSGKTLIMHINVLQFRHYLKKARRLDPRTEINKIIVLAPNEGMSNQHLGELKLSRISAAPFSKDGFGGDPDVIVIDMNKLKEEGKVKTVSVDGFGKNNLVLVDEAHRGLAGDVWYNYRSRLSAEGGFAFEYSATLKQAMKSVRPANTSGEDWKKRLGEYFRSIIIDYSYRFFYDDGYGKEYRIYNLRVGTDAEQRQMYLTGCLLSFYQQLKLFSDKSREYAPFMIEKPLLVFVGNRVTAKTSAAEMTDIEEVLDFIDKFVNGKNRTIDRITALLNGDADLRDNRGRKLFSHSFDALFSLFGGVPKAEDVYRDILRVVFNSDTASDEPRLHICGLRQVQGEIALRIGMDGEYFGVVSIGDASGLIKNCEKNSIPARTDEFTNESLFMSINEKGSGINILIGSRKFTEGWNSWRVSTMGFINFAQGEGSQAIQLFGRGVRLRGYGGCLKRSGKLDDSSAAIPKYIDLLETLTIFGVRAQYMEDFKKYLEMEDMPANEKPHEWFITVEKTRHSPLKDKGLRVIAVKKGVSFKKQAARLLLAAPDDGFSRYLNKNKVYIDCRIKVQTLESKFSAKSDSGTAEHVIDERYLAFLDYERIIDELDAYKREKLYHNISMHKDGLEAILRAGRWYSLIIPKSHIAVDGLEKLSMYTDFAVMALKSYIDKFFKYERAKWEDKFLEYQYLDENNASFVSEYKFMYYESCVDDPNVSTLNQFFEGFKTPPYDKDGLPDCRASTPDGLLSAIDFRAHLYTPLIYLNAGGMNLTVSPAGINRGEKSFVEKLKAYVDASNCALDAESIFLLRNKSKDGIGFFEAGNYYPDFIMWIDTPEAQYISFIDPKGLLHLQWDDPKIDFYAKIKELEARLQPSCPDKRIVLNSFIMSVTHAEDLHQWWQKSKAERRAKNVFCLDENDCIDAMMKKIL